MTARTEMILITGALGWLGKRLTRVIADRSLDFEFLKNLPESTRIRCLILPGNEGAELRALGSQVEVVQGALRNPADCQRFCEGAVGALLVHTAAGIHPRGVTDLSELSVRGTRIMR